MIHKEDEKKSKRKSAQRKDETQKKAPIKRIVFLKMRKERI